MADKPVSLSVVVPVYNSGGCLSELLRRLDEVLTRQGAPYEIILVDDDSSDDSWRVIEREAAGRSHVSAVQLMRNVGQVSATLCGMAYARGEIVATMDDDLQHPPEQIPLLLAVLAEHPEVDGVFGCFPEKRHRLYRNLGSRVLAAVHAHAFRLPRGVRPSSFRALRRPLVQAVLQHGTRSPSLTALICSCTRRLRSVPVEHADRFAGRSNYSLVRQVRLAFDNLCGSTTLPLKAVSWLGLVFCAGSFAYAALVLWWYLNDHIGVPGWTTLALLTSFSTGLVLLALGVFGEYLARILREVRSAPRHVERLRLGPAAVTRNHALTSGAGPGNG